MGVFDADNLRIGPGIIFGLKFCHLWYTETFTLWIELASGLM